jgi:hypothetical protein
MKKPEKTGERTLEIMLIVVTVGLAALLYQVDSMKVVVLNMFYLPVVLAGFFLGRYRAGVLALLSVVLAMMVTASNLPTFAGDNSPLVVGLAVTLWGTVLGLTSLLVGTLCDDRTRKAIEAHEAHVGVVEVLSRYLQVVNPRIESRARKVASLAEQVARIMKLSVKEIDDIRVAALLVDMENIEITARVIKKAVGELKDHPGAERTFHGSELVQSLGSVLSGAFPLLLSQSAIPSPDAAPAGAPFGAQIIRTVRAYVELADEPWEGDQPDHDEILAQLRADVEAAHHPAVLHALECVVAGEERAPAAAAC